MTAPHHPPAGQHGVVQDLRGRPDHSRVLGFVLPVVILAEASAWLVPATSIDAPGHAIGAAILVAWPFALIWFVAAIVLGVGNARRARRSGRAAYWGRGLVLQWVLITVALVGAVPLVTFDVAPDASSLGTGLITSTLGPLVVVVAGLLQVAWSTRRADVGGGPGPVGNR